MGRLFYKGTVVIQIVLEWKTKIHANIQTRQRHADKKSTVNGTLYTGNENVSLFGHTY